jgi:hypothetical protein
MRDDKSGSRGPDGSPRGPDGLGIRSRSAPASASEILIEKLERALRELRAGGDGPWPNLLRNLAFGQVEQAIQRWRAENPSSRPPTFFPLGRPAVIDRDVELLLDLCKANPRSDGWAEFAGTFDRTKSKGWIRARYRAASRKIAKMKK